MTLLFAFIRGCAMGIVAVAVAHRLGFSSIEGLALCLIFPSLIRQPRS